ncbi:MAG TPA: protein phosphatase 2C domain-containing protein [Holophaga sp.]|nr:protein phosphatase 2C domain-containing protein [Holophaga sp.]
MSLLRSTPPDVRVGALTHTGLVRQENQDTMSRFISPLGEVFLVADGMGGHKGGALAAEMVAHGLESALVGARGPLKPALQAAAQAVNEAIHREATSGHPETDRMGSTVVLAVVAEGAVTLGHVGDSRAYRFRKGRLERLTRDHSHVQQMVASGMLTEAEARDHPDASVLNRSMGGRPEVDMEVSAPQPIQDGDVILLCSDGLCGYVLDEEIGRILARLPDAQAAAEALVQAALATGGADNVTVQVIQFGTRKATAYHPETAPDPGAPAPRRPWAWIALGAALLVAVLAGGILLGLYAPWRKAKAPAPPPPAKPVTALEPKPVEKTEAPATPGYRVIGTLSETQRKALEAFQKKYGPMQALAAVEDPGPREENVTVFFSKGNNDRALSLRKALGLGGKAKPMAREMSDKLPGVSFLICLNASGAPEAPASPVVPEPK